MLSQPASGPRFPGLAFSRAAVTLVISIEGLLRVEQPPRGHEADETQDIATSRLLVYGRGYDVLGFHRALVEIDAAMAGRLG